MQTRNLKSKQRFTVTLLISASLLLLNLNVAAGRPDVRQSPFALELQPPLLEVEAFNAANKRAIDSYGNPIDALRPIQTPDGRKVVSAEGVQFEIPNYASGITEIRKPADDLLPPHIAATTTTTTTTAATPIEENPFKIATLPPWLKDFDYPDVGPGVPYNPDNFKDNADVGAQAPGASKPNDFEPNGFPNHIRSQYTTNAPIVPTTTPRTTTARAYSNTVTATSAFPSKVTLTLPANSQAEGNEEPTLVLIPPAANADETPFNTESSNNPSTINFAVRFDAPDSSTDSQKIEYTKSDDGKVITSTRKEAQANSVFQTTAPAVVAAPAVNTGKYTGGFGAPPGLLRPQNQENKPDIYVAGNNHEFGYGVKANRGRPAQAANGGRYTGGFGAPSGVLSAQQAPRPFQAAQQSTPQLVAEASSNQQSRFGGPPGVLVPFDNVQ
ncbi:uncharacterized protein LOC108596985 isoform X5 [Drosophila busckii]|uniref:uncharacterized protein LOC108596985 isoform X5 n=1 Tax=Drosophila busckii TaxID=30019 RepID=UPI0014328E61|nr:uncharacterized protein LOC108596985 isoform X5 [Drosophila busckii]